MKTLLYLVLTIFLIPWPLVSARAADLSYHIAATLDEKERSLHGHQLLTIRNWARVPLNRLHFHLFPNAFRAVETADLERLSANLDAFEDPLSAFPRGQDGGCIAIRSVLVDGRKADYLVQGTWMTVFLPGPLCSGERVEVDIEFCTKIPRRNSYFGYHQGIYTMALWYPLLAFLGPDGWLYEEEVDVQESLTNLADYRVRLRLPVDMVVAATGCRERVKPGEGDVPEQTRVAHRVRSFGWVGSADFQVFTRSTQDVTVSTFFLPRHGRQGALAGDYACRALSFFGARLGEYPHGQYVVVETHLPMGGFSLPGLCVLSGSLYELGDRSDLLESTIAHEVAHQWWGERVDAREPWFCEGFARFWEWAYMRAHHGDEGRLIKGKLVPESISNLSLSWLSRSLYLNLARLEMEDRLDCTDSQFRETLSRQAAVYAKAPLVVEMLSQLLGKEALLLFCRRLLALPEHTVITTKTIANLATELAGRDVSWFFSQWLESTKRCDYAVAQMRCRRFDQGYLTRLRLNRKGGIVMPVEVILALQDGSRLRQRWDGRDSQYELIFTSRWPAREASLITGSGLLDVYPVDDLYPRKQQICFSLLPTPHVKPEVHVWHISPRVRLGSGKDAHIGLRLATGDIVLMWAPFLFQRESGLAGKIDFKHPSGGCSWEASHLSRAPFLGSRVQVEFGYSRSEGRGSLEGGLRWVRSRYLCRTPYQMVRLYGRIREIQGAEEDFSLGLRLLWDRRRTVFFPTFGDLCLLAWEEGLGSGPGKLSYHRLSLETWHHQLLLGRLRSSLRLFAGALKGCADRKARFDLKRDGQLCGLEADSDGGHACLAIGGELRWPLRGFLAPAVAGKLGFLWRKEGGREGFGELALGLRLLGNSPWAVHIDLITATRALRERDARWHLGWNFRMGSQPERL